MIAWTQENENRLATYVERKMVVMSSYGYIGNTLANYLECCDECGIEDKNIDEYKESLEIIKSDANTLGLKCCEYVDLYCQYTGLHLEHYMVPFYHPRSDKTMKQLIEDRIKLRELKKMI